VVEDPDKRMLRMLTKPIEKLERDLGIPTPPDNN
jgi:hypothetical protein